VSAGAAHGSAQRGAIEIFAEIDEREESVKSARFQFIGEVQAAGGDAREQFAAVGDEVDDFELSLARRVAEDGLAAHLRTSAFDFNHEMQNANSLRLDGRRNTDVATCRFADGGHELRASLSVCSVGAS